jgi:hypothetical protein
LRGGRRRGRTIAAVADDGVDLIVGRQEPFGLPWQFETPHDLLALPGWPVRSFDPVAKPLVRAMIGLRRRVPDRPEIAAQFVRDHSPGLAEARDQTPPCRHCIATRLNEDIEHVAVAVDRPPESGFYVVDREDNFVEMPLVSRAGPVALDTIGKIAARSVHPLPDGLKPDDHVAFGKQILDIRCVQGKTVVSSNRVADDLIGKAKTLQARHGMRHRHV